MTRQFKRLLALILLLLGLVMIVVFLVKAPFNLEPQDTPVLENAPIPLLNLPKEKFEQAQITNQFGTYTVLNKEGSIVLVDGTQHFDEHLDSIAISNLVEQLCNVQAKSSFLPQEQLSEFGLEPARASVTGYYDGSPITLLIGNDAPTDAGVYATIQGKSDVYLIEKKAVSRLIQAPIDFVERKITDILPKNAQVDRVTLSGENYNETVIIEKSPQKNGGLERMPYQIISPKKIDGSSYLSERVIPSFFGMSGVSVVSYTQDPEKMLAFGLNKPHTIANISYSVTEDLPVLEYKGEQKEVVSENASLPKVVEKTLELKASAPDEKGFVYVSTNKLPMIFYINKEVASWADVDYGDLLGNLIIYPDMNTIQTLTITTPKETTVFELAYDEQLDEVTVSHQGKEIDEVKFKRFYESLIGVYRTYQENRERYSQQPELSVTFKYWDKQKPTDTIAYFPITNRTYQIVVNGEEEYTTTQNFIGTILQELENLIAT